MDVTVREQRPGDRSALYRLLLDAGFVDQAVDVQMGHSTHYYGLIAADENDVAVGCIDGHLSSAYAERIAEHVPPPQAWGSTLAVAAEHRREGVGQALLAEFARRARDAGSTWFVAMVRGGAGARRRQVSCSALIRARRTSRAV